MKEKPDAGCNRSTLQPAIPPEFDIERFVRIQDKVVLEEWPLRHPQRTEYERALQELQNGRKMNHWIWFIFPRIL